MMMKSTFVVFVLGLSLFARAEGQPGAEVREIALANRHGAVRISRTGARVTSYIPAGGTETLADLAAGAGGIPLCWPWFQYNGPRGEASPKHGVARYRDFEVLSVTNGMETSEAVLRLCSDEATRREFPFDFELLLTVRLDDRLRLTLTGRNTGSEPFAVTEAFHPYLLRSAIPLLEDLGSDVFRTWEPNATSHLRTQGLGPDDWRTFVCVENGTFRKEDAYTLTPGASHTLTRSIGPMKPVTDEPCDTSIQARIDAAARSGGGRVVVGPGRHLVGQIELRDHVELHLEKGAVLEGRRCPTDYRRLRIPYTEGDLMAVILAENVSDIAVTGEGEIFGNGGAWPQPVSWANNQEGYRPRGLYIRKADNVSLDNVIFETSGDARRQNLVRE